MTSFVTGQLLTAVELNAAFAQTFPSGAVSSYSATLLTGTTQAAWFTALGLPNAAPGFANGLATLDGTGIVQAAQLPASLVGALYPKGGWNANTNNPALASGTGTKGFFYVVTVAGTTVLDGNNTWSVGDCLFYDGTVWRKINGSGNISIPATNISDSTAAGRTLLTSASVAAQRLALNIDHVQLVVDTNQTITNVMEAVAWTAITAARTGTLPALSGLNAGQAIFVYDESGNCSATKTITLNRVGSDTINGVASYVLNNPFAGVVLFKSSGTKWTALGFADYVASWIGSPATVRQTVIGGPVDAAGLPSFLPDTSVSLAITAQNITGSTPLVVTSAMGATANGQTDLTGMSTGGTLTWSGLIANFTNYLGLNIISDGTVTTFSTTVAPVYQQGGTPSIVNGAITFNIGEMICYRGNGASAVQVSAVMVGQVTTDATTVTSSAPYVYNGIYDTPYTATLPAAGLTVISHNLGAVPNTCELFFKNTTAEFGYAIGDVTLARAGQGANLFPGWVATLTSNLTFITLFSGWNALNKGSAAGATLTRANWSWRLRTTRGW